MSEEKKLTDEEIVKDIEQSTGMPSYWKKIVLDFIKRQNAEIERLTEENKKDTMLLYASGLACEQVKAENVELQKQVDELKGKVKDQRREVRMARGFCIHEKRRTENAKALATCKNKIGLAEQKRQYKRGYDKAVKDTAKEILTAICEVKKVAVVEKDFDRLIKWLKERYGVEVE